MHVHARVFVYIHACVRVWRIREAPLCCHSVLVVLLNISQYFSCVDVCMRVLGILVNLFVNLVTYLLFQQPCSAMTKCFPTNRLPHDLASAHGFGRDLCSQEINEDEGIEFSNNQSLLPRSAESHQKALRDCSIFHMIGYLDMGSSLEWSALAFDSFQTSKGNCRVAFF